MKKYLQMCFLGTAVYAFAPDYYADRKIIIGTDPDNPNPQPGRTVTIGDADPAHQNTFENTNAGVWAANLAKGCNLTIANNIFTNTAYGSTGQGSDFYNTAVTVQTSAGIKQGEVYIYGNQITDCRIGIHGNGITNMNIGIDDAGNFGGAFQNTIEYNLGTTPNITDVYSGIFLQICPEAHVVSNVVTNDAAVTATGITNFRGIDVEDCSDSHLNCNEVLNLPWAMRFSGNCDLTKLKYNNMDGYEHGVHIEPGTTLPAIMGDPDPLGSFNFVPYDNEWVYGLSEPLTKLKIYNDGNPIDWYYQGGSSYQDSYYPLPVNQGITAFPTPLTGNNTDCADFSRYGEREASIGRAVNNQLTFDENVNENMYQAKMNAFNAMTDDTALIYQGKPDDYLYENFVSDMQQGNMGLFQQVDSALADSSNTALAATANSLVNDTNNVEYYLKTINNIYINTVAAGLPLSAVDSNTLDYISDLPASLAGKAVYMAAAMTGKEIHQVPSLMRKAHTVTKPKTDSAVNKILIYPNPANQSVRISGLLNETAEILIYDMQGRLLLNKKDLVDNIEISISNIANGVYRIKIKTHSGNLFEKKLSVIK